MGCRLASRLERGACRLAVLRRAYAGPRLARARARKEPMDYFEAVVLGIVEGLTEFLPVSSTGHLTIAEKLLGLPVDDPAVTAYTAVIQMGAIAAVVALLLQRHLADRRGLGARAWSSRSTAAASTTAMGWFIIVGSLPIGVVGFLGQGRHHRRPALALGGRPSP